MTRKLLAVLALALLGVGVLHVTVGVQNFAGEAEGKASRLATRRDGGPGHGIVVGETRGESGGRSPIAVSGRGEFSIARRREVTLPGGGTRFVPIYELHAEDEQPVAEDELRLRGVTLRFYRDAKTEAEHVGTVRAEEAYVQVGRDAEGRPSIREDRDFELFGVTFDSAPSARVRAVHFEVERLTARHDGSGLRFRTPTDEEPFHVDLGGDEPLRVDGRGLIGAIPADDAGAEAVLELDVASHPIVTHARGELRATGPAHYRERVATGFGRLTLHTGVHATGVLPGSEVAVATGDRLELELQRFEGDGATRRAATFAHLALHGSPARLENGSRVLTCEKVEVGPGLAGQPAVVVATGRPHLIDSEAGIEIRAEERAVLVDFDGVARELHFAMRQGTLPSVAHDFVALIGATRLHDVRRGVELHSAGGMRVYGSGTREAPLFARGFGAVRLRHPDATLDAEDGFEVRVLGEALEVHTGTDPGDAPVPFAATLAAEDGPIEVRGTGRCTLRRAHATAPVAIEVVSPDDDLRLDHARGRLRDVGTITATLGPAGRENVVATGRRCTFVADAGELGVFEGHAAWVDLRGRHTMILRGRADEPATVGRGGDRLHGDAIALHRLGPRALFVDVTGAPGRLARLATTDPALAREPVRVEALHIRFLPGLRPPAPRPLPAPLPAPYPSGDRSEWLLADGDVRVHRPAGAEQPIARGERLRVRVADGSGFLAGAPARVHHADGDRSLIGHAVRIDFRATGDDAFDLRLHAAPDIPPVVDLLGFASRDGPFARLRVTAHGEVQALAEEVRFGGPVVVQGLDERRALDPTGPLLRSNALHVTLEPATREIRHLVASGGADFRYQAFAARGERITLGTARAVCEVHGSRDAPAWFSNGRLEFLFPQLRFNYRTGDFEAWRPRLRAVDAVPDGSSVSRAAQRR